MPDKIVEKLFRTFFLKEKKNLVKKSFLKIFSKSSTTLDVV